MNLQKLLIGVLLLSSKMALGSGCLSRPTVAEAFENSKIVFSGTVVARLKYGVRFRVGKSWKGASHRFIYVYTGNQRNDTDPWFEKDEEWLVYASDVRLYRKEKSPKPYMVRLMASPCSRTVLIRNAGEDLKQLGNETKTPRTRRQ
jgi:hypothetical protein